MIKILLVDDEPIIKIAFRRMLDQKGGDYEVIGTASNGVEALVFLEKNEVDIVVTDLKMPKMDGLELIQQLSNQDFPGAILVLSNYSDFNFVREALLSGAQDYMLKLNINADSLLAQLDQLARKLESQRAIRPALPSVDQVHASHYRETLLTTHLQNRQAGEYLPASMPELLPQAPYWLFNVLLEKREDGRHISVKNVRELISAIFEDAGPTDILTLTEHEYVCLVPCATYEKKKMLPENKAMQIIRQLQIYLTQPACVFTTKPAADLPGVYKGYQCCRRAQQLLFYGMKTKHFLAEPLCFAEFPAGRLPIYDSQVFVDSYHTGGIEALSGAVDAFFAECAERFVIPKEVCSHIYQVVQVLIISDPTTSTNDVFTRHAAVLECSDADVLKALLLELLPPLMKNSVKNAVHHDNKDIDAVLLYLQYHYAEKLTLEAIAGSVNLNKSYLCRLFKRKTGKSVFLYLNELRMEKAANLIANGRSYLKEVASAVGIDDPCYFTKLFKKHYGVSPSEYKADTTG